MGYNYETEKQWLFTDDGQRALFKAADNARELLRKSGAFMSFKALNGVGYGDTFMAMAILDRLVELGDIREVTGAGTWGQDRIFTEARRK